MTETAAKFAFAGHAFLRPEPAHLAALARELGDPAFVEAIEQSPGALEPAYNHLFLNPGGTPCPPWQSAHAGEGRLMGEPHLRVLEWFRRYGIEPRAMNDPADHIGLLLLFYAELLRLGVEEVDLEVFRREHLAWIPAFCECVAREGRHPFYRLLAEQTSLLVREAC